MDVETARGFVETTWRESILPALVEYIAIPNKSPHFDPRWREHGHTERAVRLVAEWCRGRPIEGLTVEVVRLEERTPLLWVEVPARGGGDRDDTVLLYGHLDKQPEMEGWEEGLGPWTPVVRDGRLYGRGGADDGYAAFAALTAIEALERQRVPHARCVLLIEACEESGSYDLPAYLEALGPRIGAPSLVVCLDSGCGNYDQLWSTTSLRGILLARLAIEVLSEGVHSGDAGGIVPSTFRILRALLSRIEDQNSGEILLPQLHVEIPEQRVAQARVAAAALGEGVWRRFPFLAGVAPACDDPAELVLARTWRPALEVTGAGGLPPIDDAGNVLRPRTEVMLSVRIPPTCDAGAALEALEKALTADPPHGARVTFEASEPGAGWEAPATAPWLAAALERASQNAFGREAVAMGEGGSIPFMSMLGERFPGAQFLITGVLGPGSNAHGPNEFLDLATAERVTLAVASVLADHRSR